MDKQAYVVKFYVGDQGRHQNLPVYEWLVRKAADAGLAGATALTGPVSYGQTSVNTSQGLPRLSRDAPVVVEMVDSKEKIQSFIAEVEKAGAVRRGLITVMPVQVVSYRGDG